MMIETLEVTVVFYLSKSRHKLYTYSKVIHNLPTAVDNSVFKSVCFM